MPTEHRIRCLRGHWNLTITSTGIRYKCKASECRQEYTLPWEELEALRVQVLREQGAVTVPPTSIGELGNG